MEKRSYIISIFVILPLFLGALSVLLPGLVFPPVVRISLMIVVTLILVKHSHSWIIGKSVIYPLLFFSFTGIASIVWSFESNISLERAFLNFAVVLFFYVYLKKINVNEQLKILYLSCFFAFFVVVITSILAVLVNYPETYYQGNFKGYFANSNSLGHYISGGAFPLFLFMFFSKRKFKKVISLIALITLGIILIQARSRSAVLSSFISGIVVYYGFYKTSKLKPSGVIFLALVAISAVYFVEFAKEKYEGFNTFSTRVYLWEKHIEAIYEKPMLGWGVGVNPVDFKVYVDKNYNYLADTEKGNSYYVLIEELGVPISVVIYILFMPFFFKILPNVLMEIKKNKKYISGIVPISIVIGGLSHAVFESWLFSFGNPITIIFWLSCIYISNIYKQIQLEKNRTIIQISHNNVNSFRCTL